jgi:vacuolar-type H+-ATPase subunit H
MTEIPPRPPETPKPPVPPPEQQQGAARAWGEKFDSLRQQPVQPEVKAEVKAPEPAGGERLARLESTFAQEQLAAGRAIENDKSLPLLARLEMHNLNNAAEIGVAVEKHFVNPLLAAVPNTIEGVQQEGQAVQKLFAGDFRGAAHDHFASAAKLQDAGGAVLGVIPGGGEAVAAEKTAVKVVEEAAVPVVKEMVKEAVPAVKEALREAEPAVKEVLREAVPAVKEALREAAPAVKEGLREAETVVKEGLKEAESVVKGAAKEAEGLAPGASAAEKAEPLAKGQAADPVVDEIVAGIKEADSPQPGTQVGMGSHEARATAGEATMGFAYGEKGWQFLDGPSGAGGHPWNAAGLDGVAFRAGADGKLEVEILDNKAFSGTRNVSDVSAMTKNLPTNLTDLAREVAKPHYDGVPRIGDLRDTINAARDAAVAKQPLPPNVSLNVTTFAGRSGGVTSKLAGEGVRFKGTNVD